MVGKLVENHISKRLDEHVGCIRVARRVREASELCANRVGLYSAELTTRTGTTVDNVA